MSDIPNDDIRADLAAAVTAVEEANPGSTGGLSGAVSPGTEVLTEGKDGKDNAPETLASDRQRDETGKFVAKEKSGVEPEKKEAPQGKESAPEEGEKTGATEPAKAGGAPATWKPDARKVWDQIPAAARAEIERREKEIARFSTEKGAELNRIKSFHDEVEQALGTDADYLRVNYGSVGQGLKTLMNISRFAGKQPVEFLNWYAAQHNLDLKALVGQESGEPSNGKPALDPAIAQRLSGLEAQVQGFQKQTQDQQLAQRAADIASVANEMDDQGNLVRPFFDELRAEIGPLLQIIAKQNPAWSVRDVTIAAYEKAARLNDNVFAMIQQAKAGKEAEDKAARERAEAANRARKSNIGGPPNGFTPPATTGNDLRDEISTQVYASMGGSARL